MLRSGRQSASRSIRPQSAPTPQPPILRGLLRRHLRMRIPPAPRPGLPPHPHAEGGAAPHPQAEVQPPHHHAEGAAPHTLMPREQQPSHPHAEERTPVRVSKHPAAIRTDAPADHPSRPAAQAPQDEDSPRTPPRATSHPHAEGGVAPHPHAEERTPVRVSKHPAAIRTDDPAAPREPLPLSCTRSCCRRCRI
ncbi:hypothetical protein FHS85_002066 [Rhodoligotrophos appendicifer]